MRNLAMQSNEANEVWKAVPFYGMPYEVSSLGRVRRFSIALPSTRKIHPHRDYSPRIMVPVVNNGYHYITLCGGGKMKRMSVHSIVLETFVGPRPKGFYGCHNNGDKSDNRLVNLRWDSPKENQADRVRHGNGQHGEKNGSAKLTDAQVQEIRLLRKQGKTYQWIADKIGSTRANVHVICTNKTRVIATAK